MGDKRKLLINQIEKENENEREREREETLQNIIRPSSSLKSELKQFFYEQIRTSNVFFLFISVLDLVPGLNPGSKFATIIPLVCLIFMNGLFTLWNKHKKCKSYKIIDEMSDFEVGDFQMKQNSNRRHTSVGVVDVRFNSSKELKDLREGDIIRLHPNAMKHVTVPADIVLLGVECSCHKHDDDYSCGRCNISLANLTGDTRVLDRQAPERIADRYKPNLLDYSAVLEYSGPTSDVVAFEGTLDITSEPDTVGSMKLSNTNFVPRGSLLLNAVTVIGIVVFVGQDTKIASHMTRQKQRTSIITQLVDKNLLIIIYFISALSFFLAFCVTDAKAAVDNNQLGIQEGYSYLTRSLQWLMVLQKCIPISLIVSIEFINLVLAVAVSNDESACVGKAAFNSNLMDELGRVTHMFLDQNISGEKLVVELIGCGKGIINLTTGNRKATGSDDTVDNQDDENQNEERIKTLLAICNRTELDQVDHDIGQFVEDMAQVNAAKSMGYMLEKKSQKEIILNVEKSMSSYEIIETIPFSSDSDLMGMYIKEMSNADQNSRLVIKGSPDSIKRFLHSRQTKGSKNPISDSLQKGVDKLKKAFINTNEESIQDFSARGYQTLWFAEGVLNENELSALTKYLESSEFRKQQNIEGKVKMLTEVLAPESMNIVGSIGMKKKVGEEARNTIKDLKDAGIKMCLVTDDSHENSKLYASELEILTKKGNILSKELPLKEINCDEASQTLKRLNEIWLKKDEKINLGISGKSFEHIVEAKQEHKLRKACERAKSVIFTSMETSQRPDSVKLFTHRPKNELLHRIWSRFSVKFARQSCVLVVGDSSDDIPMGKEGDMFVLKKIKPEGSNEGQFSVTEASNAADFVISDLKSLKNLLLVHGIWNKRSMTQMIYFFIYKNLLLTLIPVLHCLSSGEVDIYSPLNHLMYNAFFTSFFSLSIGCFYTGYNRLEILKNPSLYQERRNRIDTSVAQLSLWCASALIHAIISYGFGYLAFGEGVVANGLVAGSLDFGGYLFLVVVVTVCLKLMFIETIILPNRRTNLEPRIFLSKIILGIGSISVIFSILFMFFDDWNIHLPQLMFSDDNVDTHVSSDTASSLWCWVALLLSVVTCLLVNLVVKVVWFMTWTRQR